ncbi:LysR family substrate-binding domain-containing protein [Nocardiopsis composta]
MVPGAPPGAAPLLRPGAELSDLPAARQPDLVRAGELDAGLVVLPADVRGLDCAVVGDAPLGVLVAADHPLAGRDAVHWGDLDGQDLLWFDRGLAPGYHDAVLAECAAAGRRPRRVRSGAARRGLFTADLVHGGAVVALRPRWDARGGLVWLPLASGAPRLRHALVWDPASPRRSGSGIWPARWSGRPRRRRVRRVLLDGAGRRGLDWPPGRRRGGPAPARGRSGFGRAPGPRIGTRESRTWR